MTKKKENSSSKNKLYEQKWILKWKSKYFSTIKKNKGHNPLPCTRETDVQRYGDQGF